MGNIKKILLVSKFSEDNSTYTYASSFYSVLQELGYEIVRFNCKKNFLPGGTRPHDYLHPYLKIINNKLCNRALYRMAHEEKPHLIFLLKAENVTATTLLSIKQATGAKLINFYPDNPFVFWNGNSNSNILQSLPLYDDFLIWSKMLMPTLVSAGARRVHYFPFAYDARMFNLHALKESEKNDYDVCFIGTWSCEREMWLEQLKQKLPDLNLAIWGNRWAEQLDQKSMLISSLNGAALYGVDMIDTFKRSKIVLNFIRPQNMTSHNMRTFEVLACKAFMLTQRTDEQIQPPFCEGENIECFDSLDELAKKIAFYLNNATMRNVIAEKGYAVAKTFTLQKQLKKALENVCNE